jgi:hypothetical protein
MVQPITPSAEAQSLYVDPTPAFQPAMDFINKQVGAANTRYAANQADIKSIFGTLTTVRAQDRQKIQDQFTKSIADQQMSLANRTAEARAGVAAGTQQMAVTAGERGQGPMPTSTPVQRAAEEGIARSNEYQQTWEALQNVMSQQAQNDVTAAVRGYDYQQASALEQLRNNLEQRLSGLEGQGVEVQGQLAGARIAGQQAVAQANYGEIQQRQAQEAALREAQIRASASSNQELKIPSNQFSSVLEQTMEGTGVPADDRDGFWSSVYDIDGTAPKDSVSAFNAWNRKYGSVASSSLRRFARDYFDNTYSNPSTRLEEGTQTTPFGIQPQAPGYN